MNLMNQNPADQMLIEQYLNGKSSSMDILIERHRNRVFSSIYLLVKNREVAEDIFQDTFVKVIRSLRLKKYQDNGKFVAWVLRIAHNLVIDHFRKEQQQNTFSKDDYEIDVFNNVKLAELNYEDSLVQEQIYGKVRSLVEKLPEDQREIVMLRHYRDMSFKDIAEYKGVSINTALGRMRYALINMRKMISEYHLTLTAV